MEMEKIFRKHTPPHAKTLTAVMRSQSRNLQRRVLPEMITLLAVALFDRPHFNAVIDQGKISDKVAIPKKPVGSQK